MDPWWSGEGWTGVGVSRGRCGSRGGGEGVVKPWKRLEHRRHCSQLLKLINSSACSLSLSVPFPSPPLRLLSLFHLRGQRRLLSFLFFYSCSSSSLLFFYQAGRRRDLKLVRGTRWNGFNKYPVSIINRVCIYRYFLRPIFRAARWRAPFIGWEGFDSNNFSLWKWYRRCVIVRNSEKWFYFPIHSREKN